MNFTTCIHIHIHIYKFKITVISINVIVLYTIKKSFHLYRFIVWLITLKKCFSTEVTNLRKYFTANIL